MKQLFFAISLVSITALFELVSTVKLLKIDREILKKGLHR